MTFWRRCAKRAPQKCMALARSWRKSSFFSARGPAEVRHLGWACDRTGTDDDEDGPREEVSQTSDDPAVDNNSDDPTGDNGGDPTGDNGDDPTDNNGGDPADTPGDDPNEDGDNTPATGGGFTSKYDRIEEVHGTRNWQDLDQDDQDAVREFYDENGGDGDWSDYQSGDQS